MHLEEIAWDGVYWIHVAQDRDQCSALVYTVMNFRVPYKILGSSSVAAKLAAPKEGLSFVSN
jgi:hypothetical protein